MSFVTDELARASTIGGGAFTAGECAEITAELERLRATVAAQAAELERLRAFRANAQRVASDIGCDAWDKPGKCSCPGCRINKADWDDDVQALADLDKASKDGTP